MFGFVKHQTTLENKTITFHCAFCCDTKHAVPHCDFWAAGTDEQQEGHWVWSPATLPISHAQWYPGEPNGGTDHNCLLMDWYLGWRWNDVSCSGITACVICEQDGSKHILQ